MKCISCGAEIGLTDEKCPYCGRTVTETAGYQADLKTYKDKNEKNAYHFRSDAMRKESVKIYGVP